MLTLKEPIQLHTVQPLSVASDSFGERIIGNYEIMGAKFEAKDLLFLMTAPAELPENLGGMTTLVQDNSFSDVQNVSMEVINNVVNRILLDGTNQFTYQDQVYITTVLNRMGITNVEQFMKEVRRLRVENESVVKMTQLYQDQITAILHQEATGQEIPRLAAHPAPEGEEDRLRRQDPVTQLTMSILNRLQIPRTYQTIHAFEQNWTLDEHTVQNNALRMTEQLRFSNAVHLAEMKQQVFQEPDITFLNHWNEYEHFDVESPASTEEKVLSQATAAALLTSVDNAVVEVLNSPVFNQQWLQLGDSLWQSAENTINRFEFYHSWDGITAPELPPRENQQWNYFAEELQQFRNVEQHYEQFLPQQSVLRQTMDMNTLREQLELRYLDQPEKAEELYDEELLRAADAILSKDSEDTEPTEPVKPGEGLPSTKLEDGPLYAPELTEKSVLEQVLRQGAQRETLPGQKPNGPDHRPFFDLDLNFLEQMEETTVEEGDTLINSNRVDRSAQTTLEETLREQMVHQETEKLEQTFHTHVESRADRLLREILPHLSEQERKALAQANKPVEQLSPTAGQTPTPVEREFLRTEERVEENTLTQQERVTQREQLVRETMERVQGESRIGPDGQPVTPMEPVKPARGEEKPEEAQREFLTVTEAEDMAPELLTREMERIDRQNRETVERVSREYQNQIPQTPQPSGPPDIKRTMQDALRALSDPEGVLRELPMAPVQLTQPPAFSPEEEAMLRQAKPEEREFYERVLTLQHNPQLATALGIAKEPSMGGLQADLRLGNLAGRSPMEKLREAEGEAAQRVVERSEAVMEHFQQVAGPRTTVRDMLGDQPSAVRIVHKEAPPDLTEELIQRLQENRTEQVTTDNREDRILNHHLQTTDLHDIEHHVVSKTTEDVTELVNRTLAKQMRTISDQVYHQMERKLQLERSRRGRF